MNCGPTSGRHTWYGDLVLILRSIVYCSALLSVPMQLWLYRNHDVLLQVAEAFAVAVPRMLPKSHSIYKLLAPHLQGTMAINALATATLIKPGFVVDKCFPPPIADSQAFAALAANTYRADFTGHSFPASVAKQNLPEDLHSPFLEDAQLYWDAISEWVKSYVEIEYTSDAALAADKTLTNFFAELKTKGQVGKFCTVDGKVMDDVTTRGCLSEVLSNIIWQVTVGHAATNFPQKYIFAYGPLAMAGPIVNGPSDPTLTADDKKTGLAFMKMIPALNPLLQNRDFGTLLGSVHFNELGYVITKTGFLYGFLHHIIFVAHTYSSFF